MIKTVAAVVCVLAVGVVTPVQAQDASGKWDVTFYTQQGPLPATVVLKKDGEKLTGRVTSQQGELAVSGTQKGNEIVLNATLDMGNGPVNIGITGKQDGDSMTGSVDLGGQSRPIGVPSGALAAGKRADRRRPAEVPTRWST